MDESFSCFDRLAVLCYAMTAQQPWFVPYSRAWNPRVHLRPSSKVVMEVRKSVEQDAGVLSEGMEAVRRAVVAESCFPSRLVCGESS